MSTKPKIQRITSTTSTPNFYCFSITQLKNAFSTPTKALSSKSQSKKFFEKATQGRRPGFLIGHIPSSHFRYRHLRLMISTTVLFLLNLYY